MTEDTDVFDTVVCTASAFHDTNNEIYTDFPVMAEPVFHADERLISIARKAADGMSRKIHFIAVRSISDNKKEGGLKI